MGVCGRGGGGDGGLCLRKDGFEYETGRCQCLIPDINAVSSLSINFI